MYAVGPLVRQPEYDNRATGAAIGPLDITAEHLSVTHNSLCTEASPRSFTDEEISVDDCNPNNAAPIQLLNCAWRVCRDNTSTYIASKENSSRSN